MSGDLPVPETRVLAIASHVVYGYVGNTMASFVMQNMGCEVSALNTVQFSNHKAYRQFKGTTTSAEELRDIYYGLAKAYLNEFDMMLTGFIPNAETVDTVGAIARDLKLGAATKPGSFFWVLDPVMGDQGRLYVDEGVVPAYKNLLRDADLLLPNQFEAELLSGEKITDISSLSAAISMLHKTHRVPHIVITSVRFSEDSKTVSVVGSTMRQDASPRLFKIEAPEIDCFFSGTGDMFAALALVRFRESIIDAGLEHVKSWVSPDDVEATSLPLAEAVEKVMGSMQGILQRTKVDRDVALEGLKGTMSQEEGSEKRLWLRQTKASEVRLVRNQDLLRHPDMQFKAEELSS